MAKAGAAGVLVYSLPGNPIQDMNCVEDECFQELRIPAAMVHLEVGVDQALRLVQKDLLVPTFYFCPHAQWRSKGFQSPQLAQSPSKKTKVAKNKTIINKFLSNKLFQTA